MKISRTRIALSIGLLTFTAACSRPAAKKNFPSEKAPATYRVKFETTKGPFVVEVHRDWAPIGADRFYTLVRKKFFDNSSFFRVMPAFVVQFGIAADPNVTAAWKGSDLEDDPVKHSNQTGALTFATAGPNTRTTQLFINTADNPKLDQQGFAPFGGVISGMNVINEIYDGYRQEPDQTRIEREGNAYLQKEFPKLDYIKTASVE